MSAVTDQSLPGDLPAAAAARSAAAGQRPRVFLHIGEPKTGSTFLQQVIWRNRATLAGQGVVLPGHHPQDHFRASQDLRGLKKLASDPAGSWTGEWDILARQSKQAPIPQYTPRATPPAVVRVATTSAANSRVATVSPA